LLPPHKYVRAFVNDL